MTTATLTKYEFHEAFEYVGATFADNMRDALLDFWTSFLKPDHEDPYIGWNFILCRTHDGASRVFIVRAEQ